MGYMLDPVTMRTDALDKQTATTGSFVDVDISTECPDATMALLCLISSSSSDELFARKNGSSDDRTNNSRLYYTSTRGCIVGLDGSQIFEQETRSTSADCYVIGYYDGSAVTMHTNATDRSTATTGSWVDVAALASGAEVGFYSIHYIGWAGAFAVGLRKKGSAEEPYAYFGTRLWNSWIVEADSNRVVQQKIESATIDLYELGYAEAESVQHDKSLAPAVDVAGTKIARVGKGLDAAVDAAAGIARRTGKLLAGAVDATASMVRSFARLKHLLGSVDLSGSITRSTQRAFLASVAVLGVKGPRAISRAFTAAISTAGGVKRGVARSFSTGVDLTGSMTRSIAWGKALQTGVEITGSMIRQAGKVLAGAVKITATRTQTAIARTLKAVVEITATRTQTAIARSFSTIVKVAGSARRQTGKLLAAAQVKVTGTVIRSAGKLLSAGVTVAASFGPWVYGKALRAGVSLLGRVTRFLYDIAYAMNQTIRQTFAKVQITFSDPYFSAGIVADSATVGRYTYAQQTADNVEGTEYKWLSLHRNTLDGSFHPLPADNRFSVGWWGTELSDPVTREFAGSPTLEITFAARTVDQLLVIGDDQLDEFPVDFTVVCYSDDPVTGDPTVVEHTEPVTGNAVMRWTKDLSPELTDITKMELVITKWSRASAVCKVTQFYTLVESIYYSEDGDLISVRMLEEMEYSGSTIPQGNVSSSEIVVRLNNIDNRFSPGNTASPLYGLLKNNRAIKAWLGVDLIPSGVRRWYPLGVFYSRDWATPTEEIYAEVMGLDALDRLQNTEFSTSEVYVDYTLEDLAVLVMTDAGLTAADWEIDAALGGATYTIPYAWFDRMTHREALRRIAAAAMGQCYCNREGKIVLEVYEAPETVSFEYTRANVFAFDSPLRWSEMVNYVEARSTPRVPSAEQEIVNDPEVPFTVPAGGAVTKTYFYWMTPCIDVQTPVITADPDISVTDHTAYAWGIMVTFTNAGAVDGDVTSVTVAGKTLETQAGRVVTAQDATSIAENGRQTLPEPLASEFWQSEDQAQRAADKVMAAYSNPRRDLVMRARGNIAQVLGDQVSAPTNLREGTDTGYYAIMRQDINWDGGLEIAVTGQHIAKVRYSKSLAAVVGVSTGFSWGWVEFKSLLAGVGATGVMGRARTVAKSLRAGIGAAASVIKSIWRTLTAGVVSSGSNTAQEMELVNHVDTFGSVAGCGELTISDKSAPSFTCSTVCVTAAAADAVDTAVTSFVLRGAATTTWCGSFERGAYYFNTVAIPVGAVINSVTLRVYITSASEYGYGNPAIRVNDGMPVYPSEAAGSPALVVGDFQLSKYTEIANYAYASMTTGSYNEIALPVTAVRPAGLTKFLLRSNECQAYPYHSRVSIQSHGAANPPEIVIDYDTWEPKP